MRHTASALLLLLTACGRGDDLPSTVPELHATAVKLREAAETAASAGDAKTALRAAEQAEKAVEKARTLAKGDEDKALIVKAAAEARSARRTANLAEERRKLAAQVSSLKAKAYRLARGAALLAVFEGLALAAREASKRDPASLHEDVRKAAELAATLAHDVTGRPRLEGGRPDWDAVASDMSAFGRDTPPALRLFLACGLFAARRNGLALFEIEMVDRASLATPEQIAAYHTLRGVIYLMNGYAMLAVPELTAAGESEFLKSLGRSEEEVLGGLHLLLAVFHAHQKDWESADVEVGRSLRVWPDNPVGVFLTGERQAADGKREEAAQSLERAAAGTESEWLAKIVAERARKVRDAKGEPEPIFHDADFVQQLVLHIVWEAARKSEAARKVRGLLDSAKEFGLRLVGRLPEESEKK